MLICDRALEGAGESEIREIYEIASKVVSVEGEEIAFDVTCRVLLAAEDKSYLCDSISYEDSTSLLRLAKSK